MAYLPVHIHNSTPYPATGRVDYLRACGNRFRAAPFGGWQASDDDAPRLLTRITARLCIEGRYVAATPYICAGTTHARFAVVQLGPDAFGITLLTPTAATEEARPVCVEPVPVMQPCTN